MVFPSGSPTGSDLLNQMYDEGVNMSEDYRFNPVKSAQNEYRHKTTNNLQFNIGAEYEIIKKLKLKVTAGYTSTDYKNEEFNGSQTRTGNSHPSNTQSKGINAYLYQSEARSYLNENTLSYQLNKNSHNFNAMLVCLFRKIPAIYILYGRKKSAMNLLAWQDSIREAHRP